MSDLRRIPRWQIGEKARIKLRGSDWVSKCCVEDLNLKGVKISIKEKLPANPLFGITLDLKNSLVLNVAIQIRWYKKIENRHYYGMEFSQVRDQDKEEISQYIQKNCFDQFQQNWWPQEKKEEDKTKIDLKNIDPTPLEMVDPENYV